MLKYGCESINRFNKEMRSKGMGIVLVDRHNLLGTILSAEERNPKEKNRKYLTEKISK